MAFVENSKLFLEFIFVPFIPECISNSYRSRKNESDEFQCICNKLSDIKHIQTKIFGTNCVLIRYTHDSYAGFLPIPSVCNRYWISNIGSWMEIKMKKKGFFVLIEKGWGDFVPLELLIFIELEMSSRMSYYWLQIISTGTQTRQNVVFQNCNRENVRFSVFANDD